MGWGRAAESWLMTPDCQMTLWAWTLSGHLKPCQQPLGPAWALTRISFNRLTLVFLLLSSPGKCTPHRIMIQKLYILLEHCSFRSCVLLHRSLYCNSNFGFQQGKLKKFVLLSTSFENLSNVPHFCSLRRAVMKLKKEITYSEIITILLNTLLLEKYGSDSWGISRTVCSGLRSISYSFSCF